MAAADVSDVSRNTFFGFVSKFSMGHHLSWHSPNGKINLKFLF